MKQNIEARKRHMHIGNTVERGSIKINGGKKKKRLLNDAGTSDYPYKTKIKLPPLTTHEIQVY